MRSLRVLIGLALVTAVLSGCWLQPRYDATRGGWNAGERTLTAANADDLVELWRAELAAPGVNAPIAVGKSLFATTTSGVAARLDAATGSLQWRQDLTFDAAGPSLSAPVWHDNQVVVPWQYFRFGNVARLSAATGALVSGGSTTSAVYSDAAEANGVLAVINTAIAPGIGVANLSWTTRATIFTGGFPVFSSYAIVGDHVLWGSGASALGYGPVCRPFPDPVPPSLGWCAPHWTTSLPGAVVGGPIGNGPDQVVYADGTGTLSVLDLATGAVVWTAPLGAAAAASPARADRTIVVPTVDGRLVALPSAGCGAATCAPVWEANLGSAASEPPVVGGDVVYVGTESGDLVAVALDGCGAATCDPLATLSTGSAISGGPIVHDGRLVAGTADGRLVAFGLPGETLDAIL